MSKDQEDRNIHEDGEKVNERAAMRSLDPQIYPLGRGERGVSEGGIAKK